MAGRSSLNKNTLLWLTTVAIKTRVLEGGKLQVMKKAYILNFFQNIAVSLCLQPWASAEIFPAVCNIHIVLILFRLLTMQCNWMFTKVWQFPYHKQNTQCYSNSQKNCASLAAPLLFKQYKTAWLAPYHYQQSLRRCIQQSHAVLPDFRKLYRQISQKNSQIWQKRIVKIANSEN